jgi:hypothetical protein
LEVQVLSPASSGRPFDRHLRGDEARMSLGFAFALTAGSLAAAALAIAYALAHR